MLAATLLTSLLAACGGNSTSIVGAWVENRYREWKDKYKALI